MTKEYNKEQSLEITPEGWVETMVFESGNYACGSASHGVEVHIKGEAGGVMRNEDTRKLVKFLKEHLERYDEFLETPTVKGPVEERCCNYMEFKTMAHETTCQNYQKEKFPSAEGTFEVEEPVKKPMCYCGHPKERHLEYQEMPNSEVKHFNCKHCSCKEYSEIG